MSDKQRNKQHAYVIGVSTLLGAGSKPLRGQWLEEHDVKGALLVIPGYAIDTLNDHSGDSNGLGNQARTALNYIEALREKNENNLIERRNQQSQGSIRRSELQYICEKRDNRGEPNDIAVHYGTRSGSADALIDAVRCLISSNEYSGITVISNDLNERLRANQLGVKAKSYGADIKPFDGWFTFEGENLPDLSSDSTNNYVLKAIQEQSKARGIKVPKHAAIRFTKSNTVYIWDTKWRWGDMQNTFKDMKSYVRALDFTIPRGVDEKRLNLEQKVALDHLQNPYVSNTFLGGIPGGGKTYLSLAVFDDNKQLKNGIVAFRSIKSQAGEDPGLVPGGIDQKMARYSRNIIDNLLKIRKQKNANVRNDGKGEYEALNGIRFSDYGNVEGIHFEDTGVLYDGVHVLERGALQMLLSRDGTNSKFALTYDSSQNLATKYISMGTSVDGLALDLLDNPITAVFRFTISQCGPNAKLMGDMMAAESPIGL